MPNKGSLFICRQVVYLVDDVLILALGLKVNRETNNGSDGSTYTTRPIRRGYMMKCYKNFKDYFFMPFMLSEMR